MQDMGLDPRDQLAPRRFKCGVLPRIRRNDTPVGNENVSENG